MLLFSPLDACSYIGIDSGASPLCLSIFFDILLACCDGINLDEYLSGSFKTNHNVPSNQLALLRQARSTLWTNMQEFQIHNATVSSSVIHAYMDNETLAHRQVLFNNYKEFLNIDQGRNFHEAETHFSMHTLNSLVNDSSLICASLDSLVSNEGFESHNNFMINSILKDTLLKFERNVTFVNCRFNSSKVRVGENTFINDLELNSQILSIPPGLFIQNVYLNIDCLKTEINFNIVFGCSDNLMQKFNDSNWSLMNEKWSDLKSKTLINESDLWPIVGGVNKNTERTLFNAKLYPIFHPNLTVDEMSLLNKNFWLDIIKHPKNSVLMNKWRESLRLSLEEIGPLVNLERLFSNRRRLFNLVNVKHLVKSVMEKRPIQFNSLIQNAVHDGFALEILKLFDQAALQNLGDLIMLPRIMMFISDTLCQMAHGLSSIRSGPSLNANWLHAFQCIENGQVERAVYELNKERQNWMHRSDLLIRASRHYEGAMLAFIRQATSSFKSNTIKSNVKKKVIFNFIFYYQL